MACFVCPTWRIWNWCIHCSLSRTFDGEPSSVLPSKTNKPLITAQSDVLMTSPQLNPMHTQSSPLKSIPNVGVNVQNEMLSNPILRRQNSALPRAATEIQLEWRDINVYVGKGRRKTQILYDFKGSIKSGELLALMGGTPLRWECIFDMELGGAHMYVVFEIL